MHGKTKRSPADEYRRMTEAPVSGLVIRLALPAMISTLVTTVYNMADTYFVSSLGNAQTTAVGVVYSIQAIIQAIGYGFGMGAQSLISRRLGEKKKEEAELYASSGFFAALFMGVLIGVSGLALVTPVMRLFGSTETALPYACDYGRIILAAAPVFCSSFVLNNILRAQGKAGLSMIGLCSGSILNIGLDWLFVRVWELGVSGAALATVIGQTVSFLLLLAFFLLKKSAIRVSLSLTGRHLSDYITVFRVGLPTVFRQSLGSLSTTLLNITVRPYGDAAAAAVGIGNKLYMLLRSMLMGVGQGFQPVAGFNYGAGKNDRVRKAFRTAARLGTVYGIAASFVLCFFSGDLIGIFRRGDTEVMEIGGRMLRYLCVSLPVLGYSTYVNQLYQSLGFVLPATFLASCRQGIFFVPAILVLPRILGVTGIILTPAAADTMTFLVSVPLQVRMFRKNLPVAGKKR